MLAASLDSVTLRTPLDEQLLALLDIIGAHDCLEENVQQQVKIESTLKVVQSYLTKRALRGLERPSKLVIKIEMDVSENDLRFKRCENLVEVP